MKSIDYYQGLSFIILCFISMCIEAHCQTPGGAKTFMAYPKNHVHQQTNRKYLEVGGGASKLIEKLRNRQPSALPIQVFAEYGKMHNPLSYVAGFGFNKSFKADSFLLKPKYVFFHAKYSFSSIIFS